MIFAVGVDHAGAPLHDVATSTLIELGHEVLDLGQCDDYPDMALKMGKVIDSGKLSAGFSPAAPAPVSPSLHQSCRGSARRQFTTPTQLIKPSNTTP